MLSLSVAAVTFQAPIQLPWSSVPINTLFVIVASFAPLTRMPLYIAPTTTLLAHRHAQIRQRAHVVLDEDALNHRTGTAIEHVTGDVMSVADVVVFVVQNWIASG